MRCQTKLVRDGNSWAVRVPKQALTDSGLKPGKDIVLIAGPGRVAIYSHEAAKRASKKADKYDVVKQDIQNIWDEAFERVWLDLFGLEEY